MTAGATSSGHTLGEVIPALRESFEMTMSASPGLPGGDLAWITAERVEEWRAWVSRGREGSAEGEQQISLAPFTLHGTIAVPKSSAGEVVEAVAMARTAQPAWAEKSVKERARTVLAFHDLLLAEQEEVLDLIQWETGKARFHAWQEIGQVAALARHYGLRSRHYLKDQRRRGMVPGATVVTERRVPKGVVGIISPWNYPLYLGIGDVLPALLAGNAVVSKADSQSPLTLLWVRSLMARAGLPADLWKIVTGTGGTAGAALIDHVDFVMFTGSTSTGRAVASRSAARLIGSSLELGGKNALIVREDADLAAAAQGAVSAAFANTGQMCIHIERILVHERVLEAFRSSLVAAIRALRLGASFDYSTDIGSLTSVEQLETVALHVDDAVARGATVLVGGAARPDLGPLFYEPTVLEGVSPSMLVHGTETFGPVVSLGSFAHDDEAVALANQGRYGLSASVWGRDVAAAERLARRIRAGAVSINDGAAAAAGSVEAGMGGMAESGLGRRHGVEGITKYTDAQTIARQRWIPLGPTSVEQVPHFVASATKQLSLMKKWRLR